MTATEIRVVAALLLAYGAFSLVTGIWAYVEVFSRVDIARQVLGDPIEKVLFFAWPPVILGFMVGSAGLLFLKRWARPVLLVTLGVEFVYGLNDLVREPNMLTPLYYAGVLAVFLLVAGSKPYLRPISNDREPTHRTH